MCEIYIHLLPVSNVFSVLTVIVSRDIHLVPLHLQRLIKEFLGCLEESPALACIVNVFLGMVLGVEDDIEEVEDWDFIIAHLYGIEVWPVVNGLDESWV